VVIHVTPGGGHSGNFAVFSELLQNASSARAVTLDAPCTMASRNPGALVNKWSA